MEWAETKQASKYKKEDRQKREIQTNRTREQWNRDRLEQIKNGPFRLDRGLAGGPPSG